MAKQKGISAANWFAAQSFNGRIDVPPTSTAAEAIRNFDRSEYCVACKKYHNPPTWPAECRKDTQ